MELLQLQYFYALAQTQHVTKTADTFHIAQPALTQMIHRLESELGVKLFQKNGRNIVLTDAGEYLKKKVEPIIKSVNEIPNEIQSLAESRKKLLKVNVLAASNLVTEALINFQKEHGGVNFRIVQNTESEQSDMTIFTREFYLHSENRKQRVYIFTERIYLAVPKASEIAGRKSVALKDMSSKEFVSLAGSRGLRTICDRFCMHAGFRPNVVFESDSPAAVMNLISASLGIGFWPQYTWGNPDSEKIALVPIEEPQCQRDIIVMLHESAMDMEVAHEFFEFLSGYLESQKTTD